VSFAPYKHYQDSGVDWLGLIPAHWKVGPSRRLFALRRERARKTDKQLTASQQHGVVFQDEFMAHEGQRVVQVIKGTDILKHVEPNDFVISMRSFQGGIEWSERRGCISSAYVVLIPSDAVHAPFFAYLLKSAEYIQALQTTTNLVRDGQAMRYSNFTQVNLPIVPFDEQASIAAFLDKETTRVDALVNEQRRLIELLAEKRQAVISDTVTKGLNPDVPIKWSGADWIGYVPEHWEVKSLRRLDSMVQTGPFGSQLHADDYISGGTPVINPVNLKNGAIVPDYDVTVLPDVVERLAHQKLRPGDIVFSRRGELGRCALVGEAEAGWLCGTGSMIVRLPPTVYEGRYLSAFLSLDVTRQFFESRSIGSTMESLSSETLLAMPMLRPPLQEQVSIATAVATKTERVDTFIGHARRSIDLLQERRVALISAAVTGRIDVRGLSEVEVA
jgi:type I restriction enzyme S subunit